MLLIENDFSFKKKTTKEGVWMLWRFMLASTVVSCDGELCVKEVGASVQQGHLYKPLADFILIYELLFPMTYSIFISYIYLFWEYIFSGMRLNKKKIQKETWRIFFIYCPYLQMLNLYASLEPFKTFVKPVCFIRISCSDRNLRLTAQEKTQDKILN